MITKPYTTLQEMVTRGRDAFVQFYLKVEDAGIASLFGLERFAWFCAGKIAGRGFTFTSYHV
ncbi:hypothetical protein MKX03_034456 [Papaver bracteatum]|nr:hypothetical protein MKX03_034456 [Papaver bracteatum]